MKRTWTIIGVEVPEALRWLFREVRLYRLWYRLRLFWNFNDKNHPALQRDPTGSTRSGR